MASKQDRRYEIARKRVEEKKKFYQHLTTYLTMSVFFVLINLFTSPGRWWFIFPVLGWGIGIVSQYFKVFGPPGLNTDGDWEERAMQEELRKLGVPETDEPQTPESDASPTEEESLELKELQKKYDERDLV